MKTAMTMTANPTASPTMSTADRLPNSSYKMPEATMTKAVKKT